MSIRARILLAALAAAVTVGGALAQDKKLSPSTESLFQAIRTNNFDAVKRSLLAGADVEAEDEDGRTAIDVAVDRGHFNIAHYLLAWRKPPQARTPSTPAPPVVSEPAPTPAPQTMPVAREAPSVLSPTPVQPVGRQPLAPTPTSPPVAATPTPARPAPAQPAPTAKIAPPAEAKPSGGFFDGVARFFGFGGGSDPKPQGDAATAAAPPAATPSAQAPSQPAPTPVTPLPATGKIAAPTELPQEEGFLESLARFFSGKSKTSPPPEGATKPQSSLQTPPAVDKAEVTAPPPGQAAPATPAKAGAANADATDAGGAARRDSLLDHIAKVLAEAQNTNQPPASEKPSAEPGPAVVEPAVVPAKAAVAERPVEAAAKPGSSILDDIARALSEAKATSEPPPSAPLAPEPVAAAPAPAPVVNPNPAPSPAPAAPAETETAAGNVDKGELLGRIGELFGVAPKRQQPSAPATETAMAAAPKPAVAPPLRPARAEPVLGAAHRLGMRRPPGGSGVCVEKPALRAAFCVEPVEWPASIASLFDVQTAIYRGRQAVVRYDDGTATQFHALFPTANFQKVVDHFAAMLGAPGDAPERWAVAIGAPNRKNRTARWLAPKAADGGGDGVLEVREIDDMRWSAPPDLEHGVVRLYRVGGDVIFQHVSWSDFLLARMRHPGN